ncbi:hypothetical protein FRC12_014459 [Ceratobasidium sp. 428]|nr:hypothetical protein FRC09_000710 [Ceratobasidium sp. 395]KAG8788533.1 hypothetical protein FRC12_014459 [Ceratobasidium sp. 428]
MPKRARARACAVKLPFDMKETYGNHPLRLKAFHLDNEKQAGVGDSKVGLRILTDHIFVKHGQFVWPFPNECTEEFFKGVTVYGFTMSLRPSEDLWFVWSLLWHLDWPTKHMELVRLDKVVRVSKERNQHLMCGNVTALWLETKNGMKYAMAEPEDQVRGGWYGALTSWEKEGDLGKVPSIMPIDVREPRPKWWPTNQKGNAVAQSTWLRIVKQQTEVLMIEEERARHAAAEEVRRKQQQERREVEREHERNAARKTHELKDERPPGLWTRTRSTTREKSSANPPTEFASPTEPGPAGSPATSPVRAPKRSAKEMADDEDEDGGSADGEGESDEELQGKETGSGPEEPPPAKRSRMSLQCLAQQPSSSETVATATSEEGAAEQRMQREGQSGYSPGPSTQQAHVSPAWETDGPVDSPASSAPANAAAEGAVRAGESRQEHEPSQASQLAGAVQEMAIGDLATSSDCPGQFGGPVASVGEADKAPESPSASLASTTMASEAGKASGLELGASPRQATDDAGPAPSSSARALALTGGSEALKGPPLLGELVPKPGLASSQVVLNNATAPAAAAAPSASSHRSSAVILVSGIHDSAFGYPDGAAAKISDGGAA